MAETETKDLFVIERSATMAAPASRVFEALVDFHKWPEWSPWEELDPEMQRTYSGSESGVGAVYEWEGNRKAGKGRMEITDATAPGDLTIRLDFIKPFKAQNTTRFALSGDGDSTEVTWTMTGAKTLMTKVMGIFKSMDAMVGPDFEKGLTQLKALVEA